jgi:hypothetical protein
MCAHEALDLYSGPEEATALSSGARFNMMQAALFNSMAASARVFDDTYLSTVVHPTSPVAAAALAVAEHLRLSGEEFLTALILGDEISCRASNMIAKPPAKSHLGLYMTSIAAGIGAAVAAAKLMKLSERETVWAIGIAVSQACGVRIMHGSRTTPLISRVATASLSRRTTRERGSAHRHRHGLHIVVAHALQVPEGLERLLVAVGVGRSARQHMPAGLGLPRPRPSPPCERPDPLTHIDDIDIHESAKKISAIADQPVVHFRCAMKASSLSAGNRMRVQTTLGNSASLVIGCTICQWSNSLRPRSTTGITEFELTLPMRKVESAEPASLGSEFARA